jgi:hypothetical protein
MESLGVISHLNLLMCVSSGAWVWAFDSWKPSTWTKKTRSKCTGGQPQIRLSMRKGTLSIHFCPLSACQMLKGTVGLMCARLCTKLLPPNVPPAGNSTETQQWQLQGPSFHSPGSRRAWVWQEADQKPVLLSSTQLFLLLYYRRPWPPFHALTDWDTVLPPSPPLNCPSAFRRQLFAVLIN